MEAAQLARYIDHTLLKPEATQSDIESLCEDAAKLGFAAVCVHPIWVNRCANFLKNSPVKVCTVVGFPFGASQREVKVFEARQAVADGAREIDVVINSGQIKSGYDEMIKEEINAVVDATENQAKVKVIIETGLLTRAEIESVCRLMLQTKAHFVKTSTGFVTRGASIEDIELIKSVVGDQLEIKASGGIKTQAEALAMLKAGATRIGSSSGPRLVGAEC